MSSMSNYATAIDLIDAELDRWATDRPIPASPGAFASIDDLGELCAAYDGAICDATTRRERRRLTGAYVRRARMLGAGS